MAQLTTRGLATSNGDQERDALTGHLAAGAILQGRYQIQTTLGIGGFSTVYQARDLRFPAVDKLWAIKEMVIYTADPALRQQTIQAFEQEASMLAVLRHPAIPVVSDYFTEGNRSYLILELVEGQNLQEWLESTTELMDDARALEWATQICEALVHLHQQKPHPVIFRDLKPSNIMLDKNDRLRLIDFGIAKLFDADQARGTMIGTEGYTPPEQYRGEATPAADIYAFGATLHHLVTRQDPRHETPFTFEERPIRAFNTKISRTLDDLIMRCVAYDAKNRFPDAMVLREELFAITQAGGQSSDPDRFGEEKWESAPAIKVGLSQVKPLWTFRCEDDIRSRAAVAKGIVFVASYDHNLYALSADRGEYLWKFPTKKSIGASPFVYEDAVYIGSTDGSLYALQLRNGRENWRFAAEGPIYASPTGRFDNVFFGADDGYLYALSALRGTLSWRTNAYSAVRSTPLVSEERVVFGTEAGEIYSKDLSLGKTQWQVQAQRSVTSSPALADDIVVIGSADGIIYALDASSGWKIWRYRTRGPVISSPLVHDGIVYVGSADGCLHAVTLETGQKVWSYQTNGQVASSPAMWEQTVFFGSSDGSLYGLSAGRGDLQWRFETGSPIIASPMIIDGTIYVGTTAALFYALPI